MSRPALLLAVACCLLPAVASHAQNWKESPFHREGFYAGLSGSYAFDQGLSNYLEDRFTDLTDAWNASRGVTQPLNAPIKGNDVNAKGSVGVNARAGYRLRPWIAAEIQVEYVPPIYTEVEIENKRLPTTGGGPAVTTVSIVESMISRHEMFSATANARLFFPTGRVQPYMLGGMGFIYAQTTGDYDSHCVLTSGCRAPSNFPPVDVGAGALESGLDFGFRAGGGIDVYLNEHFVANWEATTLIPVGKLDKLNYYSFSWGLQYRF